MTRQWVLYPVPYDSWVFPFIGGNRQYCWFAVSTSTFISSSFQWFFSFGWFPFMYALISTQLFSSSLCVQISPFICLPGLSSLSPLAQGLCRALLLPSWQPADSLKVVSRTVITYLICVTSFRDHCPSLPDIQCLTNCCFIFFF